jgi:uncharacterized protein
MLDPLNLIRKSRDQIFDLAVKHGASNIRIFGSVARGDYSEGSDIDFLVDFKPGVGLLEWSAFWLDLEDLLGCDIDVATEKSLKKRYREKVMKEARPI